MLNVSRSKFIGQEFIMAAKPEIGL